MAKKGIRLFVFGMVVMALLIGAVAIVFYILSREETTEVPLGVEHAVTLRYRGPDLKIKPFDEGVAVQLRIAEVNQRGHSLVYDIRYIINRPGEYNIMDYLMSASGQPTEDLPSFVVQGVAEKDQTIEKRVEAVESAEIRIWHWYYETLAVLGTLWIFWLAGLVFWHCRHRRKPEPTPPDYETFYSLLQGFLDRIGDDGLDAAGKFELEKLMFAWWRDQGGYRDAGMYTVLRKLDADPVVGGAYRVLEGWLHDSQTAVSKQDVIAALRPYTTEAETEVKA